jgi:Lon protease-like protein
VSYLPLFPLNTVLFPGMPLSLHIFEDRYKLMIGHCVNERQPFGVLLLKTGSAEERPGQVTEPCLVGCSAAITEFQPLAHGRMNIIAVGRERFTVRAFHYDQPYLTADIEHQPFEPAGGYDPDSAVRLLRRWLERYLTRIGRFEQMPVDMAALPEDPLQLAFLGATLLSTPVEDKQKVLEAESEFEAIRQAARLLRREITLLDVLARPFPGGNDSVFSAN